jgi:hypothetical protein
MAVWRHCSSCRADIDFEQVYWECSVSTCARVARTGLFFCSVSCWEMHLPTMRHREAWAVEKKSPTEQAWRRHLEDEQRAQGNEAPRAEPRPSEPRPSEPRPSSREPARPAPAEAPARRVVASPEPLGGDDGGDDILIVASKLKKFIRARSGMNTSDGVMAILSDHLRKVCERAVRHAAEEGRKTVLDRDFKAIL